MSIVDLQSRAGITLPPQPARKERLFPPRCEHMGSPQARFDESGLLSKPLSLREQKTW